MMTSLILLMSIVVSVTAIPLQQVLDDRLINQRKDTFPVSQEMGVSSVRVDSKKPLRKHATKVNADTIEAKSHQVLLPITSQDDRLSDFPRIFPLLSEIGSPDSKKSKKQTTSRTSKPQSSTNKLQTGIKDSKISRLIQSTSSTERPVSKTKSTILEKIFTEFDMKGKVLKNGRKHKAYYLNYPFVPHVHHYYPNYDKSIENCNYGIEERTSGGKKKHQDSNIYYIRLPPTPYMFVPGLGYVSQPPRYSPPSLTSPVTHVRPIRPARPPSIYQSQVDSFIKVPIDFVSNGKPTSVYQWQDAKPASSSENHISNMDKGPYVFNGRPNSIYLLRPDGSQTVSQPIRRSYQNNGYY